MDSPIISDPATIRNFLSAIIEPGSVFEVRIPKARPNGPGRLRAGRTYSGFYDDLDAAARDISRITGDDAPGVYVTLNPLASHVLNWGANRLAPAEKAAADADVLRLRHLYLDFDPVRPTNTNATDEEREHAKRRMFACRDYLRDQHGFPEPVWQGGSGSGGMLLYRIDLAPEDRHIVERVLYAVSGYFSDELVKVDTSVHNPARVARVAGTVNAKSLTPQPDRPWRLATGKAAPHA